MEGLETQEEVNEEEEEELEEAKRVVEKKCRGLAEGSYEREQGGGA